MKKIIMIVIFIILLFEESHQFCSKWTCPFSGCDLDKMTADACRKCYDSLKDNGAIKMDVGNGFCWIRGIT